MKKILGLLFFIILAVLFFNSEPASDESKNVFSSHFYEGYAKHLSLQKSFDFRKSHETFVKELRKRIRSGEKSDELNALVSSIYFMNIDPLEFEFLKKFTTDKPQEPFAFLESNLAKFKENQNLNGTDQEAYYQDPFFYGNLIYRQFELSNGPIVIRMPQPTIDRPFYLKPFSAETIQPEFIYFLQSQSPKKHLYVNLMKRKGLEKKSSNAIEDLENNQSNLIVITLDKNSSFYWQENEKDSKTQDFKELFLKHLFEKNGTYYWSHHLQNWKSTLQTLIENVHKDYFRNKEELTRDEKKDFIELTYLEIIDFLVNTIEPTSMNITCRQSVDRGPSLALLYYWKHFAIGHNPEKEVSLFLAPPPYYSIIALAIFTV